MKLIKVNFSYKNKSKKKKTRGNIASPVKQPLKSS